VEYGEAWGIQKQLFNAISQNEIIDTLIILQHPPVYTFGRRTIGRQLLSNKTTMLHVNTKDNENPPSPPFIKGGKGGFSDANNLHGILFYDVDRGGGATYHGPGQIVVYPVLCLKTYTEDYHGYLRMLEEVMIRTLSEFMISGKRLKGLTGVWVDGEKIASIGVRIIRGFTMHGFSLNVNNDLRPFDYIVPCNIENVRITSMSKVLGKTLNLSEIEEALIKNFAIVFEIDLEYKIRQLIMFDPGRLLKNILLQLRLGKCLKLVLLKEETLQADHEYPSRTL